MCKTDVFIKKERVDLVNRMVSRYNHGCCGRKNKLYADNQKYHHENANGVEINRYIDFLKIDAGRENA